MAAWTQLTVIKLNQLHAVSEVMFPGKHFDQDRAAVPVGAAHETGRRNPQIPVDLLSRCSTIGYHLQTENEERNELHNR
jgi:hypothetical protein